MQAFLQGAARKYYSTVLTEIGISQMIVVIYYSQQHIGMTVVGKCRLGYLQLILAERFEHPVDIGCSHLNIVVHYPDCFVLKNIANAGKVVEIFELEALSVLYEINPMIVYSSFINVYCSVK
jgi:hypothetical protein